MRKINIDPGHIAFLYEEMNMTFEQITKYLNERGVSTSGYPVYNGLNMYYKQQGKEKPKRGLRNTLLTDVKIERIAELYCVGYTYKDIARILRKEGILISDRAIEIKLIDHFGPRPKKQENGKVYDTDLIRRIEKLRIQGVSAKKIIDSLIQEGIKIPENTLYYLLKKRNEWIKLLDGVRLFDNEIEEILMRGMTIEEFVNQYGQQDNEEEIREKFKKLRVVAEYSKIENGEIIQDREFIRVLDLLEGPKEKMNKFNNINSFIVEGKLEKGKINEIKDVIFHENTDLMVYIFERLRMNLNKGYDEKIFNKSKEEYVSKVNKYLRIMELIDNNIRKTQQKQLPLKSSENER